MNEKNLPPSGFFENEEGKLCFRSGNSVYVDVVPVEFGELPNGTHMPFDPPLIFTSRKDETVEEYLKNPIKQKSLIPPSVIDKFHELQRLQQLHGADQLRFDVFHMPELVDDPIDPVKFREIQERSAQESRDLVKALTTGFTSGNPPVPAQICLDSLQGIPQADDQGNIINESPEPSPEARAYLQKWQEFLTSPHADDQITIPVDLIIHRPKKDAPDMEVIHVKYDATVSMGPNGEIQLDEIQNKEEKDGNTES